MALDLDLNVPLFKGVIVPQTEEKDSETLTSYRVRQELKDTKILFIKIATSSLKTNADSEVLQNKNVFQSLLALYEDVLGDLSLQPLIVGFVQAASQVPQAAKHMILGCGIIRM